jgi:aminoglycoside phosphotransferase (APT) family kinase protein
VVRWRPGRTADVEVYDEPALARDLTAFLAALHVPAPPGAPRNLVRGVPLAAREERFARSVRSHPEAAALRRELAGLARVPGRTGPDLWVHGDLHARNVVVDAGRVTAVIDFGDLHAGDPAIDLAWTWLLLPARLRRQVAADLTAGLGPGTWERARGWALVLGGLLWEIGRDEGDAPFLRVGARALTAAARG